MIAIKGPTAGSAAILTPAKNAALRRSRSFRGWAIILLSLQWRLPAADGVIEGDARNTTLGRRFAYALRCFSAPVETRCTLHLVGATWFVTACIVPSKSMGADQPNGC